MNGLGNFACPPSLTLYVCILWSCADDEPERGRNAPVQARGAEDTAAHTAALLRVQGDMGLGDTVPDVLHGHHGAVQRGVQEQDQRGRVAAGRRLDRRRDILHRHRTQLPHDVRRARRRGRLRPQGDPDELPPVVVRHRPAIVPAVRCVQRVRSRRRGKCPCSRRLFNRFCTVVNDYTRETPLSTGYSYDHFTGSKGRVVIALLTWNIRLKYNDISTDSNRTFPYLFYDLQNKSQPSRVIVERFYDFHQNCKFRNEKSTLRFLCTLYRAR